VRRKVGGSEHLPVWLQEAGTSREGKEMGRVRARCHRGWHRWSSSARKVILELDDALASHRQGKSLTLILYRRCEGRETRLDSTTLISFLPAGLERRHRTGAARTARLAVPLIPTLSCTSWLVTGRSDTRSREW
jgi:hypothetical protein